MPTSEIGFINKYLLQVSASKVANLREAIQKIGR
jgi:hypothetical protein